MGNVRMKTNLRFLEGCNFNLEGQFNGIKVVIALIDLILLCFGSNINDDLLFLVIHVIDGPSLIFTLVSLFLEKVFQSFMFGL